jgi:hypothetical protein
LTKCGFNKTDWCPSAKIDVYKLFVRSQMEYGMQAHLYSSGDIQMFEKTQHLALRVAFGVPWNTSKTALKKLSCLESMKCRNLLLNARFVRPIILGQLSSIPASELFHSVMKKRKSLAYKWRLGNPHITRLTHVSDKRLKTIIKQIRYESVTEENFGQSLSTNLSNTPQFSIGMGCRMLRSSKILFSGDWVGSLTIRNVDAAKATFQENTRCSVLGQKTFCFKSFRT